MNFQSKYYLLDLSIFIYFLQFIFLIQNLIIIKIYYLNFKLIYAISTHYKLYIHLEYIIIYRFIRKIHIRLNYL